MIWGFLSSPSSSLSKCFGRRNLVRASAGSKGKNDGEKENVISDAGFYDGKSEQAAGRRMLGALREPGPRRPGSRSGAYTTFRRRSPWR